MITESREKVLEVFRNAHEHPKKYCRIFWTANRKEIAINENLLPIIKATLVYPSEGRITATEALATDMKFILCCRPKKHMALILEKSGKIQYMLFHFKHEELAKPDHTSIETCACILETTTKDTFLLAFVKGVYLLQTYDSDYEVTLYDVIRELLQTNEKSKEEEPSHEQKIPELPLG